MTEDSRPKSPSGKVSVICERFEEAWSSGDEPRIEEYLRQATGEEAASRQELLLELVMIDLERRWCRDSEQEKDVSLAQPRVNTTRNDSEELPPRPLVEDYALRFRDCGFPNPLPDDLVTHEYRVRHRWGDRPSQEEYSSRFGGQRPELQALLSQIDAELASNDAVANECDRPGSTRSFTANVEETADSTNTPLPIDQRQSAHPETIGRYRVREHLGTGGFGDVYLAQDPELGRLVALKVPRASHFSTDEELTRFIDEARTAAQLEHPAIVSVYDVFREAERAVIVQRFIEGEDLGKCLEAGRLPPEVAAEMVAGVAEAVAFAHRKGFVHRDLKPSFLGIGDVKWVRCSQRKRRQARPSVEAVLRQPSNQRYAGHA